jgi:pyruvate/2-oxoglutarate dehydrogenase complex dihydrolipoamide dehydrogenase (E3) component
MAFDFDLFVIGGGSGGVRAARIAAEAGARVGLAEEYRMGGTCVIRGCVPKKLMVYAAGYADAFEDAKGYGWSVGPVSFDWGALIAGKDAEIARLEAAYRGALGRAGVSTFDTRAEVADPHLVRLATGAELRARNILIATGGHPFVPAIPGAELGIALKVEDGARRAAEPALVAVLRSLGLLSDREMGTLSGYAEPEIRNTRGELAGRIRAVIELETGVAGVEGGG